MHSGTEATPGEILLYGTDAEKYQCLAGLTAAGYDRVRDDIAAGMGIRVSTLDIEVAKLRRPSDRSRSLTLTDPAPWPEEVSGSELLDSIAEQVGTYVVMRESARVTVSLWVLLTYLVDAVFILPLLLITSPGKRCGKSTLLILLNALCRKPLLAANASKAALFRVIEAHKPTLLLDEADAWAREDDELRGLINCGHSRSTANVLRCDGDQLEPRLFDTFCPKVLAGIGSLADTIHDRAVCIPMRRRAPNETMTSLRQDRLDLDYLRAKARGWAEQHLTTIKDADPHVPEGLHDRAADNWRPLLAIADLAGGLWPERARHAATTLSLADNDDDDIRTQLLVDIFGIFRHRVTDSIGSAELVQELGTLEARPWSEWKHGKPLSAVQLARLLKPFGIATINQKDGVRVCKAYTRSSFGDAFTRYLKPDIRSATSLRKADLPEVRPDWPATAPVLVASQSATETAMVAAQNDANSGETLTGSGVAARQLEMGVLEI